MMHKVALGQGFLQILRFALPISLRHGSSHSHITWGVNNKPVRFQVLSAASMMFRVVFWDVLPCKMSDTDSSLMMEAVRTSETSVDNHFTRQYIPEDKSEQQ
jgi:pimeloyl-ACP methyl ester carboxylesterase